MYKYNSKFDVFFVLLPLELHSRRELYPFAVAGDLDSRTGTLLEGIDAILGIVG